MAKPERGGLPKLGINPAMSVLKSMRSSSPSSLTVNVLLITTAIVLIYSGIKRVSIVDAALGRIPTSKEPGATAVAPGSVEGERLPRGLSTFDGHPVSNWIIKELQWARQNGWRGHVESGWRSAREQQAAATGYGLEHYGKGGAQGSNHRKVNYPGGAVDVSQPEQLDKVLSAKPGRKLTWGGPVIGDAVHFSATGN